MNVLVLSSSKSGDFAQLVIMILLWILGITIIVAKKFDVDPNTLFRTIGAISAIHDKI